ncbi:MAG: signal peptidase I [Sedimentisphaerales bacterium]|nr:signal peptidase I [Sedimentisphaerales bacterium]
MQTTTDNANQETNGNKEPWLAASFSLLVPGAGQWYCGSWRTGMTLILLWVLLSVGLVASLVMAQVPTVAFVAVLLGYVTLWIGAIVAAFRVAKRGNTADFESARTQGKNPWRAVFYTLVVPGVGHLYLGRWFIGGVVVTLAGALAGHQGSYSGIALLALRAVAGFHAYFATGDDRPSLRPALIALAAVAIGIPAMNHALVWLAVRPYVCEVYRMGGNSMAPTIRNGTRVVSNKLIYQGQGPAAGDIVILTPPDHPLVSDRTVVCHRIAATGGQTVQVREGLVWIDGECREPRGTPHRSLSSKVISKYSAPYSAYGVTEPYRIPEGCYFVLGDNRINGLDSRCYGAIPGEAIVGKVVRVLWPLNTPPLYGHKGP